MGVFSPSDFRRRVAGLLSDHTARLASLAVAIALIWGVGILSLSSLRAGLSAGELAEHAQNVGFKLERLLALIQHAESSQRGYLISGNDALLEPYELAIRIAPEALADLRQLTGDNNAQHRRLDALAPLIQGRLDSLRINIAKRQKQGVAGIDVAMLDSGRRSMEEIGALVATMVQEENDLYALRNERTEREAIFSIVVVIAGLILSTAIIGFLSYLMMREIARRRDAETELGTLNETLEQRVAARTADLQEADNKLKSTSIFLDTVIENLPNMLCVKDAKDNRFILFNRAGEKLLGYDRSVFIGKNDYDFFPKEEADHFVERDREVLHSRKPQVTLEETITTRDKGTRLLRTTKVPVLDAHGEPRYLLAVCEDITEKKATEQQLRQAVKMEAVGQLTGGVAHDFNNLLGVIIGNLDMIMDRAENDPNLKEIAQVALNGALRGAALTKRLLAFSRKQTLRPASLDLGERLPEIATMLRRTLGESVGVELKLAPNLWRTSLDAAQMEEAILNLALNARDAMPKGGIIGIETANIHLDDEYAATHPELKAGDYVLLAVSDTGTGMPPEVRDRVFEPFFTTKGVGKGTGLGLSMVYGFVKQTGGHIKVYSEVGHGSTIKIYLPRDQTGESAQTQVDKGATEPATGDELILLVEDNDEVRKTTKKLLSDLGYRTLEADNAKAALTILDRDPGIDLLFTDVVMPGGMTGCELAREANKRRPDLKILLASGYTALAMANGEYDTEGLELLDKPFRKRDLAVKLRQMFEIAN